MGWSLVTKVAYGRLSDPAGRNVSEARAGLESDNADAEIMRALAAAMMLLLITTATLAVSPKVEGAVKVLQGVAADASKLKTFCELMDVDEKLGEKQGPVLEAQMDKLLEQLGADFEVAWDLVEDTDERPPDGRALNAALDTLEDKCPD